MFVEQCVLQYSLPPSYSSPRHSLVPVLPLELLEYTQLPSTYIMGVHTLIREQLEDELVRNWEKWVGLIGKTAVWVGGGKGGAPGRVGGVGLLGEVGGVGSWER